MLKTITIDLPSIKGLGKTKLKTLLQKIMLDHERENYNIAIITVDDAVMADLNQRFRGIIGTTDVLSFIINEDPLAGEIYISINQAKEAAGRESLKLNIEILKLALHGTLHLLGYHHQTPQEKDLHEKMTQHYLKKA